MAVFKRGYWTAFRFRGAPVRFHWTIPVVALFISGFTFRPGYWAAFVLLVMIHEMGHAVIVKMRGHHVVSLEVNGLGGLCQWQWKKTPNSLDNALISWGGVWAQMIVLAVAYVFVVITGPPITVALADIYHVATYTNLWLIGLNLIPIAPLDGKEAWSLFGILWERRKMKKIIRAGLPKSKGSPKAPDQEPSGPRTERVDDPQTSDALFDRFMKRDPIDSKEKE